MKAGLLLPRSGAYPSIAADLMAGIRSGLQEKGNEENVNFVSENVGFGGSDKDVYEKAERLLIVENVDLLIAYVDMKVMPLLEPLIYSTGKLLIVLNAGANYPERKVPQPGIIYLTLEHSFLCSLTGKVAGNATGIYASSFFDCGFMHGAAMTTAFANNSGDIIFNDVNKSLFDDSFTVEALTTFLQQHDKKELNLLCIFDEAPAALFYKKLNEYEGADKLKLFVSPMMLTKKAIGEGGYKFSVTGYTNWLPQAETEQNRHFTNKYTFAVKKDPSVFSLSGWQAGLVINEVLAMREENRMSGEAIVNTLAKITLSFPAGPASIDPDTNFYIADTVFKCALPAGATNLAVHSENVSKEDWDEYMNGQNDLPASGWINTYLCY